MLSEMPEVTELHPVPDAHVPLMGFKLNGISIDLLYAQLPLWVIPKVISLSLLLWLIIYHAVFNMFMVFYEWIIWKNLKCVPCLMSMLQDLDISQDSILQNADEQTVRSLNGCRVTDQILRLVPNIEVLCLLLVL